MKKLFLFALFAALCCSCSENGTDGNASPALDPTIFPTEIKLSSDNLRFNIAGGENSINVYYYHDYRIEPNAQWQLTGGESWCKPSATSGGEYDSISFVVDKYAGTEKRTATFTISCGNIKTELTITQTGWTVINVEKVGTLKNMLSNLNEDDINALKITGTINDEDILIIRDLRRLKHLNIAELPLITFPIYSFQGLYLNSIILPNKLQIIEKGLLSRCSSLTSIEIPASVKTIGGGAFSGCSSLTSIEIPASVKTIGSSAFSGCSSLTSIEIPASVKTIGSSAFSGCSSLTSIEIPASVETIETAAFSGCTSLKTVAFEKGSQLRLIKNDESYRTLNSFYGAFGRTSDLETVDMSECKYVWLIDKYTFSDSRIRLFKIGTNRPPQATKALHLGSPSILKVPSGSIDAYKTSDDWNMFGNILALGE
ncbi:MAG: leucine-rich repeat protein [Alistipes senegalensis]